MIPDKQFKKLSHFCKGYDMFTNGQEIEKGYRPDFVLKKHSDYVILECDNSSSRKHIIGGLVKAAHFLQGANTGRLVFIIVPKNNTKADSIAKQLKTYYSWIKDKTNLRDVYVIECGNYCESDKVLDLFGKLFLERAIQVL